MMKRALATLLVVSAAVSLHAADLARNKKLAGTWTLTAADELRPDGTRAEPYGSDADGLLIVDEEGRYSLQIFSRARPRFASRDKRNGTPQEYEAAVMGMSSHIGRCSIDPASGTLTFRIERASYPNWEGTEQKRKYRLTADELSYEIPASATADGTIPRSFWRRVR